MTAKEMFEKLGLEYNECKYHGEIEEISYINEYNYSTKVKFDLKNKRIIAYFGENDAGNIVIELLQAINKQIEELGWK